MRLVDADEIMEHVYRDKLDSRELIAQMIETAPTIHPKPDIDILDDEFQKGFMLGFESHRDLIERNR